MAIARFSEIRSGRPERIQSMQILCVLERIVCGDPHQLFTFFLVLLHSRMLSCLCRIPLLRENLCCARSTVSALGVLHAALRQPRNDRCFRPQRLERVYVWWAQTPKASRPASKRRAEIRCSVCSSGNAGGLSMAAAEAPSRAVRSFCFFFSFPPSLAHTCPPISPPPPCKQLCTRSCSNKHTNRATFHTTRLSSRRFSGPPYSQHIWWE
jgi:hypothetical protein